MPRRPFPIWPAMSPLFPYQGVRTVGRKGFRAAVALPEPRDAEAESQHLVVSGRRSGVDYNCPAATSSQLQAPSTQRSEPMADTDREEIGRHVRVGQ